MTVSSAWIGGVSSGATTVVWTGAAGCTTGCTAGCTTGWAAGSLRSPAETSLPATSAESDLRASVV